MKKFLKYAGATLLVLVLIFFSFGLFSPSITYETRTVVNKPVDSTFADFTNTLKLLEWIPGLEGIGWISGTQNEPGSKWLFIIRYEGTKYEMTQTLHQFKPNELFSFNTDNKMFTSDVEVRFTGKGASTEIHSTAHLTGKNIFWRSVFFFAKGFLTGQDQAMYGKFKEVSEKNVQTP